MTRLAFLLACVLFSASPVLACKVPVFRYALERWLPDNHRAVVFYRGEAQHRRVAALTKPLLEQKTANLEVETVDLDTLTEAQTWEYEDLDGIGPQPVLRLFLPRGAPRQTPYWEGPLNEENVTRTLDSPVRRALAESILAGSAATWLLVDSSKSENEGRAEPFLKELLARAESTASLPEGVLRPDEVTADGLAADGTPVEWDDVLRSPIPLKIAFPVLRISREDPQEKIFVSMLLAISEGRGVGGNDWLAVPVFGRGRCMPGIPASLVNEKTVDAACRYLCGECSCQVKDQNPGVDLMLAIDWDKKLSAQLVMVERELPPLTGLTVDAKSSPIPQDDLEVDRPFPVARLVGVTLGTLLLASVAGTAMAKRRRVS